MDKKKMNEKLTQDVRMRKPSSHDLNLEIYFSSILKNVSKLIELLEKKFSSEDEETISKINSEFMESTLKVIQAQSIMNSKISSHMYEKIISHPELEKIFIEIKALSASLSRSLTFILSSFSQLTINEEMFNKIKRKQSIIVQCLENISIREKDIKNFLSGNTFSKPIWINMEKASPKDAENSHNSPSFIGKSR
jgi:hypothetical protein